jgi:hypothetical protein
MGSFYRQEGGKFLFYNEVEKGIGDELHPGVELVYGSEKVAIAWCFPDDDHRRVHIFTHGPLKTMVEWVKVHNTHAWQKAALKSFDQNTPVMVLNKAINDPEYFATLL